MFWFTVTPDFQKKTESLEKSCSKRKSCYLGLRARKDVSKSQALLKCRCRRTTWQKSNNIFPPFQWKSMPGWRTLSFSGLSAHLWTSKLPTWVRLKKKKIKGASLVAQWIGSLIWGDHTCWGAAKPMCPNYWSPHIREPTVHKRIMAVRSLYVHHH